MGGMGGTPNGMEWREREEDSFNPRSGEQVEHVIKMLRERDEKKWGGAEAFGPRWQVLNRKKVDTTSDGLTALAAVAEAGDVRDDGGGGMGRGMGTGGRRGGEEGCEGGEGGEGGDGGAKVAKVAKGAKVALFARNVVAWRALEKGKRFLSILSSRREHHASPFMPHGMNRIRCRFRTTTSTGRVMSVQYDLQTVSKNTLDVRFEPRMSLQEEVDEDPSGEGEAATLYHIQCTNMVAKYVYTLRNEHIHRVRCDLTP